MHGKTLVSGEARHRGFRHAPLTLALAAALGLAPLSASAATITVTSGGDSGSASNCTLRQAIESMNSAAVAGSACVNSGAAFGSDDTIAFDTDTFPSDGQGTIILSGGRLEVTTSDLTIDASANSGITIDANQSSGVLIDGAAPGSSLTLRHLTLTHGSVMSTECSGLPDGGGICSLNADVVLHSSTVRDNVAYDGGGISAFGGSVTLIKSTVSGNSSARYGGGIFVDNGSFTLINSTVSGNSSGGVGGGILAIYNSGTLTNSTVSGNSATNAGNGIGVVEAAPLTAWNSIVSGNSGGGNDIDGVTLSEGNNLIGNVANLNLAPLADNGGPTKTMLPQTGSVAVDAGDATHCPATDQRGVPRPRGVACDIGAVEFVPTVSQITALSGSGQSVPVWQTFFNPLSVQVGGPGLQVVTGEPLHVTTPTGANQPSATCTDGTSNAAGLAYFYCRANGVAGSYVVEVHAADWPSVPPAAFVLTNSADPDHVFMDDFDPPGPRSELPIATAGADFALHAPGSLTADVPTQVHWFTGRDGQPLLRVDALRRNGAVLWRIVHYARDGQSSAPGAWQQTPTNPTLHVWRKGASVQAEWQ